MPEHPASRVHDPMGFVDSHSDGTHVMAGVDNQFGDLINPPRQMKVADRTKSEVKALEFVGNDPRELLASLELPLTEPPIETSPSHPENIDLVIQRHTRVRVGNLLCPDYQ